jgi:hypothetical protein
MYRREPRHQLSFTDFFLPFGGKLSGNNRWIKLAELVPWDDLECDYATSSARALERPAPEAIPNGAGCSDHQSVPGLYGGMPVFNVF